MPGKSGLSCREVQGPGHLSAAQTLFTVGLQRAPLGWAL